MATKQQELVIRPLFDGELLNVTVAGVDFFITPNAASIMADALHQAVAGIPSGVKMVRFDIPVEATQ